MTGMSRRRLLGRGVAAGGTLIGIMLSIPAIGFVITPLFQSRRTLAATNMIPIDDVPIGRPTPFIARVPIGTGRNPGQTIDRIVYVVRPDASTVLALSNTCSHMQCNVHWDLSLKQFLCPCHGGLYDIRGTNVGGPPPSPLPQWKHDITRDAQGRTALKIYNEYDESI